MKLLKKCLVMLLVLSLTLQFNIINPKIVKAAVSEDAAISWVKNQVGKYIDDDGVYGAQCVDLIRAYYKYLGVSAVSGNGKDYATNALPSGWTRVEGGKPKKGDILVYGGNNANPYGHVAIYESDNVTYHQNYNGHAYVEKVGVKYNGFSNPYWGYIRPKWKANIKEMTTPIIKTDSYHYDENGSVKITWDKTEASDAFYQYWIVVTNTATNTTVSNGASGTAGDNNANSKTVKVGSAGRYKITVYAVPYSGYGVSQKSDVEYISVGAYGDITFPKLATDKENYNVGDYIEMSWDATSQNSDFKQYWLVVTNTTTGKTIKNSSTAIPGGAVDSNRYSIKVDEAGKYKITVYAVAYVANGRAKSDSKYVNVGIEATSTVEKNTTNNEPKTGNVIAEKSTTAKNSTKYGGTIFKPNKVNGVKVKNIKKKKIKVSWRWQYSKAPSYGWQVQYSKKKSFKKAKIKNVEWRKDTITLKKLSKKKTYYIRVRAWAISGDKVKRFGSWSNAKKCKIKK